MIAVPRLAIVCGLLYFPEGALNVDANPETLSDMFRSFHSLLVKIRDLLRILNLHELRRVEKALCTGETQVKFGEDSVVEALTVANFHLKSTGKGTGRILEAQNLQPNGSSGSNSSDDGDCDVPSASGSLCHTNTFAYRILSPIRLKGSSESSSTENSSKLDLLIMTRPPDPHRLRARFRSSADLIHRLFVCICGVADQLQTNYPTDLRRVLKMILQPNDVVPISGKTATNPENEEEMGLEVQEALPLPSLIGVRWVPDSDCEQCTACSAQFTLVRRRHHCRNCGRIFCSRCSANSLPLPELGYDRKVRVCNLCFMYKINPFSPCTGQSNSSQNHSIIAFNNAVTSTAIVLNQVDHERDEDGSQNNESPTATTATTI
ncbi:ZFYVE28 protein [Wuchereria bancrofti]|uniref:ZFYVE28 protein n=1 Tax=Wuchereria bancrofti TaxID=6293 RepID=J9BIQ0_WUCBA|nr:ZFYVE28 protein [Wuchereria bancrofti]